MRLYELGNIYLPKTLPLTELPEERMQFTLGMYGDGDFFTMKGVVEEFFDSIGMKKKAVYDPKAGRIMEKSSPSGLAIVMAFRRISSSANSSLSNTFGLSKE